MRRSPLFSRLLLLTTLLGCESVVATPSAPAGCDSRMAQLPSGVCMDRHEARIVDSDGRELAHTAEGELPTDSVSFDRAMQACNRAGYRLCTASEWDEACRGEGGRDYPYGESFEEGRCNTPPDASDVSTRRLAIAGQHSRCVTPEGIFDLSGNLGEWIDSAGPSDDLRELRGGSFANYPQYSTCGFERPAFQPRDSAFSGQGFRCCADAQP